MELSDRTVFRLASLPSKCFSIFKNMRSNSEFCDITINFGNLTVVGHRIVLLAAFPGLINMFVNHEKEANAELEMESSALESLIDFAYNCELEITNDNVEDLLMGAVYFKSDEVESACIDFLCARMNHSNAVRMWKLAEYAHCLQLGERCHQFILENFDRVAATQEFLHAPFPFIKDLIRHDDLKTSSEEKVFEAVMNWCKQSPSERKDNLPELLSLVRLTLVPPDYLKDHVSVEEDIHSSIACRDVLDEVKYFHLLPQRRKEISSLVTQPRKRQCLESSSTYQNQITNVSIYAISKSMSLNMQCLDLETGEWKVVETPPVEIHAGALVSVDDMIYFYDDQLRSYSVQNAMWFCNSKVFYPKPYASVATLHNKLYIFGGTNGECCLNTALSFDFLTKKHGVVSNMPDECLLPGAVALQDYVYVLGGHNGAHALSFVRKYDPGLDLWTMLSNMNSPRFGMGCVAFFGKIYVCSGRESPLRSGILNSVEVYDPMENQWKYLPPMNTSRYLCSLVAYKDKLYAIGGLDVEYQALCSVEIYDPQTNEWTFGPSMNSSQKYALAVSVGLPSV